MRVAKKITIPVLSITIASAVVLCMLHAKDVTASLNDPDHLLVKTSDSSSHNSKVGSDLHHHGDATIKIQKTSNDHQVDSRSLRLLHMQKRSVVRERAANRIKHWWQIAIYRELV